MTKQERNWLIGATITTVVIMAGFLFLMSDFSPLYHPAGSNTQALIDQLGSWQQSASESGNLN